MIAPGAGRAPSAGIPLAYLTTAAASFVLAALGILWLAPDLAGHYYHPHIVALTHTVTLGWVTVAIMGASYQLIPIVLERPVWSPRLARWQLGVLIVGISGMVAHFYLGTWPGLVSSAAFVAIGVGMHLVNVALTLRGLARWTFTARLVALSYMGLALTAAFGLTLGLDRVWKFLPGEFFPTLSAHVQLALLGWVAPMIVGVAARVYPMFLLAPEPGPGVARLQFWGIALGMPSLVMGLLGVPGIAAAGAVVMSVAAGAHAWWIVAVARRRRRPGLDWGLRFVLTAAGFLAPACAVGLAITVDFWSGPRAALGYVVLLLGGWVSLTIVGMMLKIVPFLVWYRVYSSRAGRHAVPTLTQMSWPAAERATYALLVSGIGLLATAVVAGEPTWIRAAGVVVALGGIAFAAALGRVLAHLGSNPHAPVVAQAHTG